VARGPNVVGADSGHARLLVLLRVAIEGAAMVRPLTEVESGRDARDDADRLHEPSTGGCTGHNSPLSAKLTTVPAPTTR